jgi:hypothetical protein
MFLSTMKFEFQ